MHRHPDNRHRDRGFRGAFDNDGEWERPRLKRSKRRRGGHTPDDESFPAGRANWKRWLDEDYPDSD